MHVDRMEASHIKFESKVQKLMFSRDRTPKGKENRSDIVNKSYEIDSKSKLKADFVTK